MRASLPALLAGAVCLALAPRAAAAQGEFHWNGKVAPGKSIEIKGVNGDVRAVASSGGGDVEVTAVKHAHRSDPDDVKIEVVPHEDGVTICAVYPGDGRRENTCDAGRGGHMNVRDNDVTVDFTVRVPAGVRFVGTTVNGEVVVSLGRATWSDALEFRTVNGGITLDLPAGLSTEVRATTVNGDIQTDFPLMVTGRLGPRRLHGTIGSGGRRLALETVNGSIRLRKSS